MAEDQRRELIVQAVDDVLAKHEERVDARKEEDLAFLRTLRASLLGRLLEVSTARKGLGVSWVELLGNGGYFACFLNRPVPLM